ncbi:YfcE family phosphodiesterase [Mycoplasmopsis caviae]|uniref:Phosphoesterase n=1 Tax=Mycoplasmopsis caviae TaxID=55603 RepID=A0A3P8MDI5_9BACT|nr:YfcE family phosphodiesterase [Mycoplasmopsis caviae]UUD35350.1 YfcE family phosphodiesterase [Mycoplasmopsis caviae]VDR41870.1 phosphoesterase [Mycoplasmopsis caviae]
MMNRVTKILVLSDIHGNIDIVNYILKNESYEYAISCGDHLLPKEYMNSNFDFCVDGNNDIYYDESYLKSPSLDFEIEGYKFHIEHGHMQGDYNLLKSPKELFEQVKALDFDFFLYGHSHFPINYYDKATKRYLINPGSTTLPRWGSKPSYVIIELKNNKEYGNVSIIPKEVTIK